VCRHAAGISAASWHPEETAHQGQTVSDWKKPVIEHGR
jgi:hypothetical protein